VVVEVIVRDNRERIGVGWSAGWVGVVGGHGTSFQAAEAAGRIGGNSGTYFKGLSGKDFGGSDILNRWQVRSWPVQQPNFPAHLDVIWDSYKYGESTVRKIQKDMEGAARAIEDAYFILKDHLASARALWVKRGKPYGTDGSGGYVPTELLDPTKDPDGKIRQYFLKELDEAWTYLITSSNRIFIAIENVPFASDPLDTAHTLILFGASNTLYISPSYFPDNAYGRKQTCIHELGRWILHIGDEKRDYRDNIRLWDSVVEWFSNNKSQIAPKPIPAAESPSWGSYRLPFQDD
jgi:hypothetical protein